MKPTFNRGLLGILLTLTFQSGLFAGGVVSTCDEASLRAALAGGGTVTFACDGTITLVNTLAITNNTVIDASGHSITISGGNSVRLLTVDSGVNLGLVQLTLANGQHKGADGVLGPPITDGQPGLGGAILNNGGTVALTGCTVVSNSAVGGNGLANTGTMVGSLGGSASGGAIFSSGSVFATNSSFVANESIGGTGGYGNGYGSNGGGARGGAIGNSGGTVVVQSSTFTANLTRGGGASSPTYTPGQAGSALGGAVWGDNASVSLYGSTFANNTAAGGGVAYSGGPGGAGSGQGGAVYATNGGVNCLDCTFTANTVQAGLKVKYGVLGVAQGGAIWGRAMLAISQSGFHGNQARGSGNGGGQNLTGDLSAGEGSGGAIYTESSLSLSASLFDANTALGGDGGVVVVFSCPGGMGRGGAVCSKGTLLATNCTFEANSATGGQGGWASGGPAVGGSGMGGALYSSNGIATLMNLTLASNSAAGGPPGAGPGPPYPGPGPSQGGALLNTNGTMNLQNTILANSTSGSNCSGMVFDWGHNLSSDISAGFYAAGSLNNTDPVLAPLDNYGGPTLTMALLAGSPAIDGGDPVSYPPADQRGHARPFGSASDIGAFESSPPYTVHGTISGFTFVEEVSVTASSSTTSTTNHGAYNLGSLSSGTWSVTPQSPSYLFLPNNQSVTVGPDQLGVDFKAYRWNAMSLEGMTNNTIHVILAGTNSVSYRLLSSGNLRQWSPVATNTIGPSSYWEMFLPVGADGQQFYRTVTP
jgi:hypothetical protein